METGGAVSCGIDSWIHNGELQVRVHRRERRDLFTPLRVSGAGPAKALFSVRITEGAFRDSGQQFRIVDAWTSRASAHKTLAELWTGTTTFVRRSAYEHSSRTCAHEAPASESAAVPVGGSELCSPSYSLSRSNSCCPSRNGSCNVCNMISRRISSNSQCVRGLCGCQCSRVQTATCSPRTGSGATTPLRSGVKDCTGCDCVVCVCDACDMFDICKWNSGTVNAQLGRWLRP